MLLGSAQPRKENQSRLKRQRMLREEDHYGRNGRKDRFFSGIMAELNPKYDGGKDTNRGKDRQKQQQIQRR